MSAYIINDGMAVGLNKFRCSQCGDNLRADNSVDKLKHCWHCGEKFGPEPKQEPTGGEWYYSDDDYRIRTINPGVCDDIIARLHYPNYHANGHLMAAAKKLLAACKDALRAGIPNISVAQVVVAAIAEAEKGKQ